MNNELNVSWTSCLFLYLMSQSRSTQSLLEEYNGRNEVKQPLEEDELTCIYSLSLSLSQGVHSCTVSWKK